MLSLFFPIGKDDNFRMLQRKKVIIVGAGVSGLTAGIYCLDNGFDVAIYEKHAIPGGECTGWYRKGSYIEGCAHWVIGTNPKGDLYPLWEHIGAFDEKTKIYPTESLSDFDVNGKTLSLWGDLSQLEKEFCESFPEDKRQIRRFIKSIKAYSHVKIPTRGPLSQMNPFYLMNFSLKMAPMVPSFLKYKKMSMGEYVQKFKNEDLRNLLLRAMKASYNAHSFLYVMQSLYRKDAGVIEGGSIRMVSNIRDRFLSLGGSLYCNRPVQKVIFDGDKATGILLENGDRIDGDYVIVATDAHHACFDLLADAPGLDHFRKKYEKPIEYPLNIGFTVAFRTSHNVTDFSKMDDFRVEETVIHGVKINHIPVRNYAFDSTYIHDGKTLLTILLDATEESYQEWKKMSKEEYAAAKEDLAEFIKGKIAGYWKIGPEEIETLDVATPLTYERYCNAYHGSYMSFIATKHNKTLMESGKIKGIKNVILSGQWLMFPGGLPIALFTGKHAAYRVCKLERKRFIHNEKRAQKRN